MLGKSKVPNANPALLTISITYCLLPLFFVCHDFRLRSDDKNKYLPIVWVDELSQRLHDQVRVNSTDTEGDVEILFR